MIEVKNITRKYGDLQVLKGIDLSIASGEILTIVGASGAGKSTLLQIMGTLDKPDTGEVYYNGKRIDHFGQRELARFRNQNIGFVFQFHHLLPEFTALENICIPAFINGVSRKEAATRAHQLLDKLGVHDRHDHKPNELSGGEQQRVAVARALVNNPSVILADEPTGNLDSANAKALHELFFSLRDELGQTFVIVTHNEELARQSDRVVNMKDGVVV
jgi:lipoprotein-releasing system ATP-binding protein